MTNTLKHTPGQLSTALNIIGTIGAIMDEEQYDVNPYTFVNDMSVLAGYGYNELVVNAEDVNNTNQAQASSNGLIEQSIIKEVFDNYSDEEMAKAAEIMTAIAKLDVIPNGMGDGILKALTREDI